MKLFRTIVFWMHLTAGLLAGVVILVMSVTGVMLTYEQQIIRFAERDYWRAPPSPSASHMAVEDLLRRVMEQRSTPPTNLTIWSDPDAPASVTLGREGVFFVNPYSGEILGQGNPSVRAFMRSTMEWHRYLAQSGESRPRGKMITGACNLAFLFLVVSGFYLWWPRKWNGAGVRAVTLFRRGLKGRAREFNWHNVAGFWMAIPLFFVVITATPFSYPWANALVFRLAGDQPPAPPAPRPAGVAPATPASTAPSKPPAAPVLANLNSHFARAAQQVEGWTIIGMKVPTSSSGAVEFAIDTGSGRQPQKKSTLVLNGGTGAVEKFETFSDLPPGRRLRSITRYLHTGEVLGIVGQTIAGIASAAGALLVYTGVSLSMRRFFGRKKG